MRSNSTRVESTLQRLRLEEARRQALRPQEAQHVPEQVLHPRGHRQEHRLHGRAVRVVTSRQRYRDPSQMFNCDDGNNYYCDFFIFVIFSTLQYFKLRRMKKKKGGDTN